MGFGIDMVDLRGQYARIKSEVDAAMAAVLSRGDFINGEDVRALADELAQYNGSKFVIPCANGTDALQIALMALGLQRGDEVLVPAFTYVASAEVIGLLGLVPVMVDVDPAHFTVGRSHLEGALSERTRAVIPVHLFGQSCDMDPIMAFAREHGLYVVEDNAQAIGADYRGSCGVRRTGAIGHIGCTSFFPSKNLGCYGDGGALFTDDEELAKRIRMIANHGQSVKYQHQVLGCNSRLDTLQAAVLRVKLRHLDEYNAARQAAARYYSERLSDIRAIVLPAQAEYSTHVYHQYTLRVVDGQRDALREHLAARGIPSMVYYPLPLQAQEAFRGIARQGGDRLSTSQELAGSVLSLPMHTELTHEVQDRIVEGVRSFFA